MSMQMIPKILFLFKKKKKEDKIFKFVQNQIQFSNKTEMNQLMMMKMMKKYIKKKDKIKI